MLADLDRAGLLPHGRRAAAELLQARYPAPHDLAAALTRRGWLTPLQARFLARSRMPFVGPYLLLRRLGRGGMGDVYLARHRHLGREAAIKTARVTRDTSRARFLRECEALGRLDHPRVAHAFDAGEDGRVLWLALEYVSGPDLGQVVTGGQLSAGLACRYACQAADGLAHVHARGLVHRDVKPANLMLDRGGGVKVLDVGLSRPRRAAGHLTRAGLTVGTPDYMAPEQVEDSRRVGPAADQYGLGCTLYHLLTGRVPFPDGSAVAKMIARLTADPPPVDALRPNLPAGLAGVVGRLLARRPTDRFPDMGAVADALAPFAGQSVPTAITGDTAAELPALSDAPTQEVSIRPADHRPRRKSGGV